MIFCLILIIGLAATQIFALEIKSLFRSREFEIRNADAKQTSLAREDAGETASSTPGLYDQNDASLPAVNFLILGAPGRGNDAPDLTDTILLARLDETKNKIYLFSLPRDLLVRIPGSANLTKLNALYAFNRNNAGREFDALKEKVQDISGLPIDHYIFVDLQTVRQLVDIFGGVNILVTEDILDRNFPGPNHSFTTFEIKAGWRYLDGETALKYLRTRHSVAGDFDRTSRQQEVLQALKQKVLALNFWDLPKFLEIYNALASNIKSDLGLWQIKTYWDKIKNIPGGNVVKNELNKQSLLVGGQADLGGETASVLQPKAGLENYEEIRKYIAETVKN